MESIKDLFILIFGIFVFAFIIVFMTGQISPRKQDFTMVVIVMAFIIAFLLVISTFIANPIIGIAAGYALFTIYKSYFKHKT